MHDPKENAITDCMQMIKRSWTWQRMTDKEQERFKITIADRSDEIRGDYRTRYKIVNLMYGAYLNALGYIDDPISWRDPDAENKPQF